eukprot:TRINITY_DN941_c0_g1_i4.p1 TRINITY_DN941_c0_g1~~TRINITY_DN941_c0_g1_i4.p1  ORF type:complete len:687 (-),score=78.98 TRINITY_DN941_c0_g1_i4:660-2720(-)
MRKRRETEVSIQSKGTSVNDLPDPLLADIFSIINDNRKQSNELLHCMEVCKRWRETLLSVDIGLNLQSCFSLRFGAKKLTIFPNLTSLTLEGCSCVGTNWTSFFRALGQGCKRLSHLSLESVEPRLKSAEVASLASNLTSLLSLHMASSVHELQLLPVGGLQKLQILHIKTPPLLAAKPLDEIAELPNLRVLVLQDIAGMQALPPIRSLSALETVELDTLVDLKSLPSFIGLSNLRTLKLCNLPHDVLLMLRPRELPGLQTLSVKPLFTMGPPMQPLPEIGLLTGLKELELRNCSPKRQGDISHLHLLQRLAIPARGIGGLISFSSMSNLESISIVDSMHDGRLHEHCRSLPSLEGLHSLTHLHIESFSSYRNGKEQLLGLRRKENVEVVIVDHICHFAAQQLDFAAVKHLSLLPFWSNQPASGNLPLDPEFLGLALSRLPNLTSLKLFGRRHMPLPQFCSMPALQELYVASFEDRGDFSLRKSFPALTSLTLVQNTFESADSLMGAPNLRELTVSVCTIPLPPPFSHLHALRSLEISDSRFFGVIPAGGNFSFFEGLSSLQDLQIHSCEDLVHLPPLSPMTSLRQLSLHQLVNLTTPPDLHGLSWLRSLSISHCRKLTAFPDLSSLRSLRSLDLSSCPYVERTPSLSGLSRLLSVSLVGCDRLSIVPSWEGLSEDVEIILPEHLR